MVGLTLKVQLVQLVMLRPPAQYRLPTQQLLQLAAQLASPALVGMLLITPLAQHLLP